VAGLKTTGTAASLKERRLQREQQGLLGGDVGDHSAGDSSGITLAIDAIAPHPKNRKDLGTADSLQELADSLRAVEVRQGSPFLQLPVVTTRAAHLREWPDHESLIGAATHVMVFGHRRMAAARLAGFRDIPVLVRDEAASGDLETMIIENAHRKGLNPIEQAVLFGDLKARGRSERQIAKDTGVSQPQINKRLKLLTLPQAIQDGIAVGQLPVIDALNIAALGDKDGIREVWAAVEAGADAKDALAAHHAKLRVADAEGRARAEGLSVVDPLAMWGDAAASRYVREPGEIEEARISGTLAAAIADDGSLAYVTTANPIPEPRTPSGESRDGKPSADSRRSPAKTGDKRPSDPEEAARAKACARLIAGGDVPPNVIELASRLLVGRGNTPDALHLATNWLAEAEVEVSDPDAADRVVFAVWLAGRELELRGSWPLLGLNGDAHLRALAAVGYEAPAGSLV
jgi:ParB family chromosome partitioning protein